MIEYFDVTIALLSLLLTIASTFVSRGQIKLLEDLVVLIRARGQAT